MSNIISKLQSRIDKRGNGIAAAERIANAIKREGRNIRTLYDPERDNYEAIAVAVSYFHEAARIRREIITPMAEAQKLDAKILKALHAAAYITDAVCEGRALLISVAELVSSN